MELDIKTVTGGPLDVNTYVVGASGSNQCVLIDPGAEYAAVNGAVCGREVKAVLLTHAHFDHMLYARPWLKDGVKLYVHKLDAPALADPESLRRCRRAAHAAGCGCPARRGRLRGRSGHPL